MPTSVNGAYRSLLRGQFRLMRLGTDLDSPVSGHLEDTVLANAPPYYAVSHAWSPGVSVKAIPQSNQIQLSHDLAICVRRLQIFSVENSGLDPRVTHIWIDSICINQQDLHERSQQVAMMGRIYSQSVRTLIWLGEAQLPSIHVAWNLIADIYTVFRKQNPRAKALSEIPVRTYDKSAHIASGLPPLNDSQWEYIKVLTELRWFTRIWVVQEVVLSQEDPIILHGDCHYAWESLGWAVGWLRRSGYLRLPQIPEQLRNVDTISNLRRAQTRWPLAALMSITQVKFTAPAQRDKVYGVLGLALEGDASELPEELKPDYTIDTATLYQRVARFLLKRKHSLAVLTRARGIDGTETRNRRVNDLALPSWCPDWSDFASYNEGISTSFAYIEYSNILKPARLWFPNQYRAADGLELSLHSPESGFENSSILQLEGFRVDQVAHVHRFNIDSSPHGQTPDEFDAKMAPIINLSLSFTPLNDALTWMEQFIRTTTASQHYLCGKGMGQSISDGASWLYGFLNRREDTAWPLHQQTSNDMVKLQIHEASTDGIEEDYIALRPESGNCSISERTCHYAPPRKLKTGTSPYETECTTDSAFPAASVFEDLPVSSPLDLHDIESEDISTLGHLNLLYHVQENMTDWMMVTDRLQPLASGCMTTSLKTPYLMNQLLALSAMHLKTIDKQAAGSYINTAAHLRHQALRGFNKCLGDTSKSNSTSQFFFASLLALHYLAETVAGLPDQDFATTLNCLVNYVRLHRGARVMGERASTGFVNCKISQWLIDASKEEFYDSHAASADYAALVLMLETSELNHESRKAGEEATEALGFVMRRI
ncbi:hypothetical protein FVEG_00257 [Fusarium verticillioides 7600]|uniref:Heterokaryon incompatibility domain-containing protein n=1 Tax=Gibberella moniliformis (strain M3125 / FGSC 7600) TaxID=334819 RepID=W7LKL8_GIBM7|nr:hypothetical protein FVEG_00257 [Fusarium verticillioides 7600]EWG36100.1 hypothetical protein FVEG_00257 [Fusarium verticillioides 7600]